MYELILWLLSKRSRGLTIMFMREMEEAANHLEE